MADTNEQDQNTLQESLLLGLMGVRNSEEQKITGAKTLALLLNTDDMMAEFLEHFSRESLRSKVVNAFVEVIHDDYNQFHKVPFSSIISRKEKVELLKDDYESLVQEYLSSCTEDKIQHTVNFFHSCIEEAGDKVWIENTIC